jgi:peptidyl-prolyl cis-trans isomerase C
MYHTSSQRNFHKSAKAAFIAFLMLLTFGAYTYTAQAATPPAAKAAPVIKPGNPVVAKVGAKDITRADVLNFIQTLPPQTRQMPVEQLFPLAQQQLVNTQVIIDKTKGVKLDGDPEVKKQMDLAKEQIVRSVYLQKEVDKQITDAKVKDAYATYVKNFPADIQEVKAAHILVKDEAKAKDLIKQLNGGGDFAKLASENSIDATAKNGGELGYFAEKEVVPPFAKAAFATAVGTYTKAPVKTDFGYHIIKVEDKRKRPPADFETAKPLIEAQLRREILEGMIKDWRDQSKVEVFDINGDKVAAAEAPKAPEKK